MFLLLQTFKTFAKVLSRATGDLDLEVVFVTPEPDSDDEATVLIESLDGTCRFPLYAMNERKSGGTSKVFF